MLRVKILHVNISKNNTKKYHMWFYVMILLMSIIIVIVWYHLCNITTQVCKIIYLLIFLRSKFNSCQKIPVVSLNYSNWYSFSLNYGLWNITFQNIDLIWCYIILIITLTNIKKLFNYSIRRIKVSQTNINFKCV